jgi:FdhE protein
VAPSFIRKLIGRAPDFSPEVKEALEELARVAEERPALAGSAQFLRELFPDLFERPIDVAVPPIASEQARTKLEGGLPLLRGETFALDKNVLKRRWLGICVLLQRHQDPAGPTALAEAVRRGALDLYQLTAELLNGRPEAIHVRADELGLDAGLTATVLRLTLFPVLCQISSALAHLRAGYRWERGFCPICGSWPLLGEFRGLEQTRFLRCGWCASEWEFPRLRCPFCGTADHRQLGYFHVENEEAKYRAATCDSCRGYVKMISSLTAFSPVQLLVKDLATIHLDLVAAERGYWQGPELANSANDLANEES